MDETPSPSGSGNGHATDAELQALAQDIRILEQNILLTRNAFARQLGLTFGGKRDMYGVLGYPPTLTTLDYRDRYARGGIASRIVDAFPNATWRGEVEVVEDEDPEKITTFEQAWIDLDQRLQVQAKLLRVDKLSQLSTYAVLLIGAGGELDSELPKGSKQDQILYLSPFLGGGGPSQNQNSTTITTGNDCTIESYVQDPKDTRFGLPMYYLLRRLDINDLSFTKRVHWTRILHVAEGLLDDDVFGKPSLERVWNLLDDLDKVTGGGAEAFWLRANQGMHLDIDKDMSATDAKLTVDALKEQAEAYQHQLTRWLRTRGVSVNTLGSDVANFQSPADAVLTQIAGAKGIPKRILTGSEMGELASSQDRDNWKDQIVGRQTQYAGPYIVRPLVDRLIAYGYLPVPMKGAQFYDVKWPHIQTMTAQERADGALKWAQTNATQGTLIFTDDEIRDNWQGFAPLTQEQKDQYVKDKQATRPPTPVTAPQQQQQEDAQQQKQIKTAEDADELLRILEEALETGNVEVVHHVLGLPSVSDDHVTS